jgi:anaerobic magnesium-protoporphyrin IX monomethyl ester cyclase
LLKLHGEGKNSAIYQARINVLTLRNGEELVIMRVMLIAPPIMDSYLGELVPIAMDAVRECPPYGVYLLQAVLRGKGHEAIVADLIADGSDSISPYESVLADCGLVGIGATSMSWPTALRVVQQVRARRPEIPIVLGGIHPTMFDDYLLSNFPVDFIVRGEGERAIVELADVLEASGDLSSVANLSWRSAAGQVVRNPVANQLSAEELALEPIPDYSQLPEGIYKGLSIESSRGCAFDCSFCSTSYRRSYRSLAPAAFVDRLQAVAEHTHRCQQDFIHIVDDEFSMNPRRAIAITNEFRARKFIPRLVYDSRATDLLFPGYVESIAEFTGQFLVGAECGYDEGLKRIGKGTTTDILERAARLLAEHGLAARADFSFILGLPWETAAEVHKTCAFAAHLYGAYGVRLLLQWYCQIPGSRLWQDYRDRLEVSETMYNDFGFFRNIYLFRTGVQLSPAEIWSVSRSVTALRYMARVRDPNREMVEYGHPEPINLYFPQEVVERTSDSLANLRAVARARERGGRNRAVPSARQDLAATLPLRHLPT